MFHLKLLNTVLVAFAIWAQAYAEDLRSGLELEFGTWHPLALCPPGSFARGFEVAAKDEVNKLFNDELAMTGMRLYCSQGANHSDTVISSYVMEGAGSWRGKSDCPNGDWIIGFRLRLANYMGVTKDDTATNDANVICSSGLALPGRGNIRGDWQQWANCSEGAVVCGLATKADDARMVMDKAGIVTVHLHCCPLNSNLSEPGAMELQSKENALHSAQETSTNKDDAKQSVMGDPQKDFRSGILHEQDMSTNETLDSKHADDPKPKDVPSQSEDTKSRDTNHSKAPKPEEDPIVLLGSSDSPPDLSGNAVSSDMSAKLEPKLEPKQEPKQDTKQEPKQDTKQEPKQEPIQEPKQEPKHDENTISKDNPIKFPV